MVTQDAMKEVKHQMEAVQLLEDDNGSAIINFSKHVPGIEGITLTNGRFCKKDGTSLYLTRDIGVLFARSKAHNFDQNDLRRRLSSRPPHVPILQDSRIIRPSVHPCQNLPRQLR